MKFGYLFEKRDMKGKKTDLFEIWPKNSCNRCNGMGRAGFALINHVKHEDDKQKVLVICDCLGKQQQRIERTVI